MNARILTQKKPLTTSALPVRGRLSQRKCACGGTPGPTGECAECRKKRLQLKTRNSELETRHDSSVPPVIHKVLRSPHQSRDLTTRAFMEPRFGHDFSRVSVRPPLVRSAQMNHILRMQVSRERLPEEGEPNQYSEDGLLVSRAGSGTCVNGGGESVCDPDTGKYKIISNGNTCCTKSCTQEHEQRHVTDHDGWGCCAALAAAWGKKGADTGKLAKKYNDWFDKANLVSECNAYNVGVTCADALAKTKDCTGAGKDTDCCKDIADYRASMSAQATSYCGKAPKKVPPCPAF